MAFSPARASAAIVCAGFAAGIALSLPLWYSAARLYPRAPIVRGWSLPSYAELILVACLLGALAAVGIRPRPIATVCALALVAVFTAFDQSRLQPWVYEYSLLLGALGLARKDTALKACRLIVVALYFWSAIQKMNVTFLMKTWPELTPTPLWNRAGWIVPLAEIAVAIGLCIVPLRRPAIVAAVATHAVIFGLLVSSGENRVVWPWNIASALLAIVLFWPDRKRIAVPRDMPARVFVSAVWVLPVLNFFGAWDAYLSFALYAGNTMQAVVLVPPESIAGLPEVIRRNTWQSSEPMFVDLNRWSYDELAVPAYPARRVMTAIGMEVCQRFIPEGTIEILGRADWLSGRRSRTYIRPAGGSAGDR